MRTIVITLAAAMLVAAAPAFAQSDDVVLNPLDVSAVVTDVVREHGVFVDVWTVTVDITNTDSQTLFLDVSHLWTDLDSVENNCEALDWTVLRPGQTKELTACFLVETELEATGISFYGYYRASQDVMIHLLPFTTGQCELAYEGVSCQRIQRIDRLIEDIEPEPVQCVAPPSTPTDDAPTVGSAAYHTNLDDMILTFDTPVTLADGWQDSMSILATNGTDNITLDGLRSTTSNLMPDDSTLVWLSLSFSDYRQLDDITALTLSIDPGTITYDDGQTLGIRLNVPVALVP